nr:uncharacterized protein LOC127340761 [Lolium perenne]XP_051222470.1 uncharacterized protein LOC127340761 [Lolium perenne]
MVLLSEIVYTFILADFCYYYVKSLWGLHRWGQSVPPLPQQEGSEQAAPEPLDSVAQTAESKLRIRRCHSLLRVLKKLPQELLILLLVQPTCHLLMRRAESNGRPKPWRQARRHRHPLRPTLEAGRPCVRCGTVGFRGGTVGFRGLRRPNYRRGHPGRGSRRHRRLLRHTSHPLGRARL